MADEMEHPGKNWNSIETWCNKYLSRIMPPRALRWFWVLAHGGCICCSAFMCLIALILPSFLLAGVILFLNSEKIVDANPAIINPENNGRLVRMSGKISVPRPAFDSRTGVSAYVPTMRLEKFSSEPATPEKVAGNMEAISTSPRICAPEWRMGAFRLVQAHRHSYINYFDFASGASVRREEMQFSQPPAGLVLTPLSDASCAFRISSSDGQEFGLYRYQTPPEQYYLIGRQLGDEIDLADPQARLGTDEESVRQGRDHVFNLSFDAGEVVLSVVSCGFLYLLLCLMFSSVRAALYHASGGRDLLRLTLSQASLLLGGAAICMTSAFIQQIELDTQVSAVPYIVSFLLPAGLLAYAVQQWLRKK